ncbi:MAG: helix-turn-helix transcriptional regulator [Clostridia bacterium]|nr:helix-turn-helix transcriptional regulator [Clostridia bacterium]
MSNKVVLDGRHFSLIRKMRESLKESVESVSRAIGKSPAWVGQLERGRFASIKRDTLVELLKVLYRNEREKSDNELLERFEKDIIGDTYASFGHPSNFELLGDAIASTSEAIKLLLELIRPNTENNDSLRSEYNHIVIKVNLVCDYFKLGYSLRTIQDAKISALTLVRLHHSELLKLLEKLLELQSQLESEEKSFIISRLEEEATAEYHDAQIQGMLPEQWEIPSLPDDDQTTEPNDNVETQTES